MREGCVSPPSAHRVLCPLRRQTRMAYPPSRSLSALDLERPSDLSIGGPRCWSGRLHVRRSAAQVPESPRQGIHEFASSHAWIERGLRRSRFEPRFQNEERRPRRVNSTADDRFGRGEPRPPERATHPLEGAARRVMPNRLGHTIRALCRLRPCTLSGEGLEWPGSSDLQSEWSSSLCGEPIVP